MKTVRAIIYALHARLRSQMRLAKRANCTSYVHAPQTPAISEASFRASLLHPLEDENETRIISFLIIFAGTKLQVGTETSRTAGLV